MTLSERFIALEVAYHEEYNASRSPDGERYRAAIAARQQRAHELHAACIVADALKEAEASRA